MKAIGSLVLGGLLCLWQATGVSAAVLNFPVERPGDLFLLKADGQPFKDEKGKYRGKLTVAPYRSRLDLTAISEGKRRTLSAVLVGVDSSHGVSDDRPLVFMEVDGITLQDGLAIDSVISTFMRGKERITRINFNLLPPGIEAIQKAKSRVAIKVRMRSDIFAVSGECSTTSLGSAKSEDCRKPYTGRTLEGKALAKFKAFLK
ncbi:MAG: hypothetical protein H7Y37_08630 [Anaerolineae bacterium]|nr:hypothetical protein [Gloeobacterales cyanobacterium ES-bin-313]